VNAVLRRATREPSYDPLAAIEDPIARLAIETSHPRWLIERWVNAFGLDEAAAFARANNQPAPAAFRFTARATGPDARARLLGQLEDAGAKLVASKVAPDAWRISGARNLVRRMVDDGLIYLQDEASQLLAHLMQVEANQRVLDVTAAPGSKATHIAAIEPTATVVAGDLYQHRIETMRRLATTQGARVAVLRHDATRQLPFPAASFDRVLLDAPCSGTGTLRRNPEIRYRFKPDALAELAEQQKSMLGQAALVLRPGGRLIYSTCSVEPEENEYVVDHFASGNPTFTRLDLSQTLSSFIPPRSSLLSNPLSVRLWPHRHGVDGFFIAGLERNT
jgi:16S rRNA (cytosine967-C5)-methyltransferase